MRACEELDGRPTFQVSRFQKIAAAIAAISTTESTMEGDVTMSPPIVLATPVETIAPTKFKTADIMIATFGFSARVATQVAIALAVSWNPFIKSNERARMIRIMMR